MHVLMRLVSRVRSAPLACQPGCYQRCVLPCDEAAVVDDAVLHEDAPLFVGLDQAPAVVPVHLSAVVHVSGSALKWQTVPMEHHLSLRGDQLKERELQRPSCRQNETRIRKWITINSSLTNIVKWTDCILLQLLRSSCENDYIRDMTS